MVQINVLSNLKIHIPCLFNKTNLDKKNERKNTVTKYNII